MWDFLTRLFENDFMPHGTCYGWLPEVVWMHVISDALIAFAYATIPISLAVFAKKRNDLAFKWMFLLFSAFILLCGATHAMNIFTVWYPTYRLTGIVKFATGLVSVGTALALIPMIPKALKLPSPRDLREANKKLQQETEERLKAEAALAEREKEELFRAVVEAAPNGMVLLDENQKIVLVNSATQNIFGHDRDDILGQGLVDFIAPKYQASFAEQLENQQQLEIKDPYQPSCYGLHKDGTRVPLEVGINPVKWHADTLLLVSLVDISERLEAQQALVEANQRFNRAVEGTSDAIWEWQLDSNIVWFSPAFFDWFEGDEDQQQIQLDTFFDLVHPDDMEGIQKALKDHLEKGIIYDHEYRLCLPDGDEAWFRGRGKAIRNQQGEPYLMSGSLSNIHRRKQAEQAVFEQKQFLQVLFDGINHAVFVVDINGENYTYSVLNRAWAEMTGIPRDSFLGKPLEALAPEYLERTSVDQIRANFENCRKSGKRIQIMETLNIKGQKSWWITTLIPLFDQKGKMEKILGSASNVTEIKMMEEALREREQRTRNILDTALNGIFIFQIQQSCFTYINPAYTKITGYTLQDLHGTRDLTDLVHPEDRERVSLYVSNIIEGDAPDDGQIEYRIRHSRGRWLWCLSSDTVFSRTPEGKVLEIIGTLIDITEMKAYSERLEESNEELERFAFVASHDLREPLRKIQSFGNMLRRRYEADLPEKGQDYVVRMVNAADRMQRLIDDLLQFSRVTSRRQDFSKVDLNEVLQTVLHDLSHRIGRQKARVTSNHLPTVSGDSNQLYQLLLNLIGNALKYAKKSTALQLSITCESVENGKVKISLKDNGIGFDNEFSEDIFQIFKRLHGRQEYEGSGIGLAICKKIVERHHGTLTASGEPDVGAVFEITLPVLHHEEG